MKCSAQKKRFTFAFLSERPCRTLRDFYHFIDLLGRAVCNVVVLDIDVDANIAQLVWLKLWAMFKLLPIYLRSPIGFCAPLHTIVCFPLKEKYTM